MEIKLRALNNNDDYFTYLFPPMSDNIQIVCKQHYRTAKVIMENKETSTNYSDFDDFSELEKRIECLEDELTKVNAKVTSLKELLILAENALSRCTCPDLKDQILSLSLIHI